MALIYLVYISGKCWSKWSGQEEKRREETEGRLKADTGVEPVGQTGRADRLAPQIEDQNRSMGPGQPVGS